jgi:hypothetical protein
MLIFRVPSSGGFQRTGELVDLSVLPSLTLESWKQAFIAQATATPGL